MAKINETKNILKADDQTRAAIESAKANVRGYGRTVESTTDRMKRHWASMKRAFAIAAAAIAAAAIASAAALWRMTESVAGVADHARKTAQGLGLTTEALQELTHAAAIGGVEQNDLETALRKLAKTAKDAERGLMTYKRIYDELGISIKDSHGNLKTTDVLLAEVANRFAKMPNDVTKTAIATDLFGRSGSKLIPLLNSGAAGIAELRQEARRFGVVISDESAQKAEEFNDTLFRLKQGLTGLKNSIGIALIPELTRLGKGLTEFIITHKENFITFAKDAGGALLKIGEVGVKVGALLYDSFNGLVMLWEVLKLGALKFYEAMIGILHKLREANVKFFETFNFKGIFDEQIENSKRIAVEQELILWSVRDEIAKTEEALEKYAGYELAYGKVSTFIEELKQALENMKASLTITPELEPLNAPTGEGGGMGEDGMTQAQKAYETEQLIEYYKWQAREEANQIRLEQERAITEQLNFDEYQRVEMVRKAELAKNQIRGSAINQAIGFLQVLGAQSKAAAIAGIAITKALEIARTIQATHTAAMLAYASQLIPGDPTSIIRAQAAAHATLAWGYVQAALIAATGLAQAMSIGASPSAPGGTAGEPLPQNNAITQETPSEQQPIYNIHIYGNVVDNDRYARELIASIRRAERAGVH